MSVYVAIETATDVGSIAVGDGAALLGEVALGVHARHAEMMLPALDFILQGARVDRTAITGVVVGAGPGSFTGVRIAGATARGLAMGLNVPLFAFSSLAALAASVATDRPVCALFDARRGEVYAACYVRAKAGLSALMAPAVCSADDLRERVSVWDPVYIGDGARRYADVLRIAAPVPAWPRASQLLALAAAQPEDGRVLDMAAWEPDYLRASGAERGIAG
jgi:tRNA threonylcarbamoyladenosine biosynthesis protein TsaB